MPVQTKIKKTSPKAKLVEGKSLWQGPCSNDPQGGITQSMINSYLACHERFRIKVVEGLSTFEGFNAPLEYGNMWHICEEALAANRNWQEALKNHCMALMPIYSTEWDTVKHWWQTCKAQFPIYIGRWSNHKDVRNRTPLMQEVSFTVPYDLPSGRVVILRGKWDAVDLIKDKKESGIWLQENKTKGRIDEGKIERQLKFDLQTMTYLIALESGWYKQGAMVGEASYDAYPIKGVRYNVIRRPFSGGKGSIKRHQPTKSNPQGESEEQFYQRLQDGYFKNDPKYWFMRWEVQISQDDIDKFKEQTLNPILENTLDDYEWWDHCHKTGTNPHDYMIRASIFKNHHHRSFRTPYGIYNPMAEGRDHELDVYLDTGNKDGLMNVVNLFPELS